MDSSATFSNALILGAALSVAVSLLAYVRRWLTLPAAALATLIGTVVFATGKALTLALLFFFFSTRLFERSARSRRDAARLSAQQPAARSFEQVAAVGTVPAICAAGELLTADAALGIAALAAIAFATADTWGTAVGMTSPKPPRLLGFGRRVPAGFSGGVSLRGTLASILGALSIGLITMGRDGSGAYGPLLRTAGMGLAAAFLDSLLGAVAQLTYRCRVCEAKTEVRVHCGRPTVRQSGLLSNAGVNLVCSLTAALVAYWIGT